MGAPACARQEAMLRGKGIRQRRVGQGCAGQDEWAPRVEREEAGLT